MCGSRGFNNYRHQADLYSWMNVLLNRGFKRENIITFSYNDLPELTNNTIQHTCHGPNMYIDNAINFSFNDANKDMFIRTIKTISGKNINVLIIYINHGAYNMLSTPNSFDRPIYVDDFADAVNHLSERVRKVCCIIEACYSGSMATRARYNRNIIFITAADAKQSSYSYCWCPEIRAYTTDEFTYHLLNYLDNANNDKRYITDMTNYLKQNVKSSNVISSGLLYRVQLRDFFGTMNKNKPVLGNTTVDNIKRVKNTMLPRSELRKVYIRIRNALYDQFNMTLDKEEDDMRFIHDSHRRDRKKTRETIRLIKNPDIEMKCYKQVSNAGMSLFMTTYLEDDSIEFLHDVGLLCAKFNATAVVETMKQIKNELDNERVLERESRKRNDMGLVRRRFVNDRMNGGINMDAAEDNPIQQRAKIDKIIDNIRDALEQAISVQRPGRDSPDFDDDEDGDEARLLDSTGMRVVNRRNHLDEYDEDISSAVSEERFKRMHGRRVIQRSERRHGYRGA